ncbi:MAG: SCO family protein [Burkholderiales bacterium]
MLGVRFIVLFSLLCACGSGAWAHKSKEDARLPSIGPAPAFTLTTQAGKRLSMRELSGSVVVVTFIFTSCRDTCPMLTAKLVQIKKDLDRKPGKGTVFAAITVDPEKDTPAVLAQYAKALGATDPGWVFLSGSPEEVQDVTRRYAIFARKQVSGDVDHTFLTSLIDRKGMIRVQYLGVRFSPREFMQDVQSLLRE